MKKERLGIIGLGQSGYGLLLPRAVIPWISRTLSGKMAE